MAAVGRAELSNGIPTVGSLGCPFTAGRKPGHDAADGSRRQSDPRLLSARPQRVAQLPWRRERRGYLAAGSSRARAVTRRAWVVGSDAAIKPPVLRRRGLLY